jgi:hypothetical protein
MVQMWSSRPNLPTVARELGWSRVIAYRAAREQWLPARIVGNRWMVSRADLDTYVAEVSRG